MREAVAQEEVLEKVKETKNVEGKVGTDGRQQISEEGVH